MPKPRCTHLAGHCTQAGDHHDHLGQWHSIPNPRPGLGGPHLARVRLEEWAECEPVVALYPADDVVGLDPRQAARAAVQLVLLAGQMLHLAAVLRRARRS
jgi:hypothetical protein